MSEEHPLIAFALPVAVLLLPLVVVACFGLWLVHLEAVSKPRPIQVIYRIEVPAGSKVSAGSEWEVEVVK